MPKKETFTGRFEETREGRVPQKSKIWGDVVYGWSLRLGLIAYALPKIYNLANKFQRTLLSVRLGKNRKVSILIS